MRLQDKKMWRQYEELKCDSVIYLTHMVLRLQKRNFMKHIAGFTKHDAVALAKLVKATWRLTPFRLRPTEAAKRLEEPEQCERPGIHKLTLETST